MSPKITLEEVIRFLLQTPIFSNLSDLELGEIVKVLTLRSFSAGEVIFREGEPGDAIYVLYRGRVRVLKEVEPGKFQEIDLLERHSVFGEMAIIDGMRRSATTEAQTDVVAFRIAKAHFDQMIARDSIAALKLSYHIARIISQRKRESLEQIAQLVARTEGEARALAEEIQKNAQPWGA